MTAPLAVCTKEEQRAVIGFIWSEGVSGAEIHRRLSTQHGNSALTRRSVYEICQRLLDRYKNEGKEDFWAE
jgi:hypothetical protein